MSTTQATNNLDGIIATVQKLLAMTTDRGCTESEASNAAILAEKMLTENKLALADVMKEAFAKGEIEAVQDYAMPTGGSSIAWLHSLVTRLAKLAYCKAFITRVNDVRRISFVGFPQDVQVATALLNHFIGHGVASMELFRANHKKNFKLTYPKRTYDATLVRDSFLMGYSAAVSTRLDERLQERAASVCDIAVFSEKAIDGYFKKANIKLQKGRSAAPRTHDNITKHGYAAGMKAPMANQAALR